MKLFKFVIGSLVLAFVGLFIYQNLVSFRSPIPFNLDLYVHEQISWNHPLYTVIGIAALLGFALGVLLMLKPYLKARRRAFSEPQEQPPTPEAAATAPKPSAAETQSTEPSQAKPIPTDQP